MEKKAIMSKGNTCHNLFGTCQNFMEYEANSDRTPKHKKIIIEVILIQNQMSVTSEPKFYIFFPVSDRASNLFGTWQNFVEYEADSNRASKLRKIIIEDIEHKV